MVKIEKILSTNFNRIELALDNGQHMVLKPKHQRYESYAMFLYPYLNFFDILNKNIIGFRRHIDNDINYDFNQPTTYYLVLDKDCRQEYPFVILSLDTNTSWLEVEFF